MKCLGDSFLKLLIKGWSTILLPITPCYMDYFVLVDLLLVGSFSMRWKLVTNPWFAAFAVVFFSSLVQHLCEVVSSGGSVRTMWNEQSIWKIKISVTKANFRLTNNVIDQEKLKNTRREDSIFQDVLKGVINAGNVAKMFVQGLLCFYALVLSFPTLEGLIPKIGKMRFEVFDFVFIYMCIVDV
ncbi:hypothetical protein ACJIZ3_013767 [Penstemon smallii]|uniref:Uncharacterized protein n=1 Tax=Penstemon smallii TaxID=265156 RepID=A0ABD3RHJ9_9LAMI